MSVPVLAAALLSLAAPSAATSAAPAGAEPLPPAGSPQPAPAVPEPVAALPTALTVPSPAEAEAIARAADGPAPASDIVVSGRGSARVDPLESLNAESFKAIQAVDDAVVAPVAEGYKAAVPSPVRAGLRNFLRNLDEPVSFVNYLLQLKPGRAAKSLARFTINTTIGIAGLVDVAKKKPFNLPYKPNGFANTLACYGVGNGPYFFLPLVGPITLRDLGGLFLDRGAVPFAAGKPFNKAYFAIPAGVIDSLNDRVEQDAVLRQLREDSGEPYVAVRELYLRQRRAEIGAICPRHGDPVPDPDTPPRVGKGED